MLVLRLFRLFRPFASLIYLSPRREALKISIFNAHERVRACVCVCEKVHFMNVLKL